MTTSLRLLKTSYNEHTSQDSLQHRWKLSSPRKQTSPQLSVGFKPPFLQLWESGAEIATPPPPHLWQGRMVHNIRMPITNLYLLAPHCDAATYALAAKDAFVNSLAFGESNTNRTEVLTPLLFAESTIFSYFTVSLLREISCAFSEIMAYLFVSFKPTKTQGHRNLGKFILTVAIFEITLTMKNLILGNSN